MFFQPRDYQLTAMQHLREHPGAGFFVRMGGGKTAVTGGVMQELLAAKDIRKVLVVGPVRVVEDVWPSELAKWDHTHKLKVQLIRGKTPKQRDREIARDVDVHLINYELLPWLIKNYGDVWPWDMVVFDESSRLKDPSTDRWKAVRKIVKRLKRVVILSGTPASAGYLNLWSQVFLLDQGKRLGKSMSEYKRRYFVCDEKAALYTGYLKWTLREGAEAEIQEAIKDICLSIETTYDEIPSVINDIPIHLDSETAESYRMLEHEMFLQLEAGNIVAGNAAVVTGKCHQFTGGALYLQDSYGQPTGNWIEVHKKKLEALDDIIEEAAGSPVLVAYQYHSERDRILDRYKHAQLLDDIDAWNRGELPIALIHPASAGHGLNLQFGGNILVWYSLPWSLEQYEQTNARLVRPGQESTVSIHRLIVPDTVDEVIAKRLISHASVQEALLEALKDRKRRMAA